MAQSFCRGRRSFLFTGSHPLLLKGQFHRTLPLLKFKGEHAWAPSELLLQGHKKAQGQVRGMLCGLEVPGYTCRKLFGARAKLITEVVAKIREQWDGMDLLWSVRGVQCRYFPRFFGGNLTCPSHFKHWMYAMLPFHQVPPTLRPCLGRFTSYHLPPLKVWSPLCPLQTNLLGRT